MSEPSHSTKREIRNLIGVILSGVIGACLLTGILLHFYGPTGRYYVSNVLLSPDLVQNLSYQEVDPKTGQATHYVFRGIEFAYYDPAQKKWISFPVLSDIYEKFYQKISNDLSLEEISNQILDTFYKSQPAKLTIKIKTDSAAVQRTFQDLELADQGDYYRVQLRQQTESAGGWVYFYHPGIYQEAMNLFSLKS